MNTTARLIVLNKIKIGDKSLVLQCCTREWGRRSFIVSSSSKGGTALYAPLNILDAQIISNARSDLWRAHAFVPAHPLTGIRKDLRKNAVALFLSEVLYRTLVQDQADPLLYDHIESSIVLLDSLQGDWYNFHLRFLLDYCGYLGFAPSPEALSPFAGEQYGNILRLLEGDSASSLLLPLRGEDRSEIAGIILRYISCHLETTLDIRSLEVLRELFRNG